MLKNSTPRQIAILAATATGGATIGVALLAYAVRQLTHWPLLAVVTLIAGVAVSAYFIILSYLDKYIYRKIKLIYKTIHNQKVSSETKATGIDADQPIIDNVEQEVKEWADKQRRQVDQLERFAEYRRRYVGDISHELKTPIFNMQGYLHTLLDDEGTLDDKKFTLKFLRKAAKNVERLQTIVEDLSAIGRLESGEFILDLDDFNIRELVQEVFEELDLRAEEAGIELVFKPGADGNFRVRADRESIRQVLINLVSNSLKYGNEGGQTKVGLYDMDRYLLCEVADDGIGIPEKHLPHVFDRFYRVDKSRSRQQGGSGLGLSIVKHIVEAHGQTINVRSSPGRGSTFGITLAKS